MGRRRRIEKAVTWTFAAAYAVTCLLAAVGANSADGIVNAARSVALLCIFATVPFAFAGLAAIYTICGVDFLISRRGKGRKALAPTYPSPL